MKCLGLLFLCVPALACSIARPISNVELVKNADAIVRAAAVGYVSEPKDRNSWTTGVPDSTVRFKVLETIRGADLHEIVLPGYVVSRDDFNEQQPPYTFVRPGGRRGSCYANSYRAGAEFLLFLKVSQTGTYTVNWYALAPVNEQLHGADDPWLVWVRERARLLH